MDDEADILRKADALLSKHRPASTQDFPVLTEVVDPTILARQSAMSAENGSTAKKSIGGIPQIDLLALEDRVLARALINSDSIVSDWSDSSLRRDILSVIQSSMDKLEQEVATMLSEKVSALVRESVRTALESELLEIRNGRDRDSKLEPRK